MRKQDVYIPTVQEQATALLDIVRSIKERIKTVCRSDQADASIIIYCNPALLDWFGGYVNGCDVSATESREDATLRHDLTSAIRFERDTCLLPGVNVLSCYTTPPHTSD